MGKMGSTKKYILDFYYGQLDRYAKIGIGNESEFGTIITPAIISITELRLLELKCNYKRRRNENTNNKY